MNSTDLHTDGNAIAGLLREIFASEMTAAVRTCQSCGQRRAIGSHRLYSGAGLVLRCPSCGDIAACIGMQPGHYVINLRGAWAVERPAA